MPTPKGPQKPAYIRTGAPMVGGSAIVYVARLLGLDLSVDQALVLAPVVMYLYYVLGRALETWHPVLGYVLGIAKQPAYASGKAPAPDAGEDVVAVVEGDEEPVEDVEEQAPVQTDNGPKPGDEFVEDEQGETFQGVMR